MAWEPDYIEREELKDFITQGALNADYVKDNDEMDLACSASSRAIDRECTDRVRRTGIIRQFGQLDAPEARFYTPYWSGPLNRWVAEIDDLMDASGLVIKLDLDQDDEHEVTVTDYVLRPRGALSNNRPYTQVAFKISGRIQPVMWPDSVMGIAPWGWTSYPPTIKQAGLLQASRFAARRMAPFGTRGSPSDDTEESLEFQVDPDVRHMLKSYVRQVETL